MREGKNKEMIRLIDEIRELLPDFLLMLGAIDQLRPPSPLRERIHPLRMKIERLMAQARRLEEATDCMPAAEAGRRENPR